ncbi:LacI family DNA-binding transcriptional regulator [Micrococcales bacterium 31B]|nr:LacI family DNA-binding transcriptional regulator [Micrococcales bacterium 31B]
MQSGRRPSMHDVAREAGVSYQTVSRVLNEPDLVRATTRERVQAAIDELGFHRNLNARALKTAKSSLIGLIHTGSSAFGPASIVNAIGRAAQTAHLSTLTTILDAEHPERAATSLRFLAEHMVQGIAVVSAQEWIAEAIAQHIGGLPVLFVTADTSVRVPQRHATVDQARGMELLVEHLRERGRRRIAHIAGPGDWFDARVREAEWRRLVSPEEREMLVRGSWSADDGFAAMQQVLAHFEVDAVVAANDAMALGAVRALQAAGLSVPGDVAVVGFDDVPGAAYFAPGLTTIRQPFEELGAAVVAALAGEAGDSGHAIAPIAPHLVVRASS